MCSKNIITFLLCTLIVELMCDSQTSAQPILPLPSPMQQMIILFLGKQRVTLVNLTFLSRYDLVVPSCQMQSTDRYKLTGFLPRLSFVCSNCVNVSKRLGYGYISLHTEQKCAKHFPSLILTPCYYKICPIHRAWCCVPSSLS